MIRSYLIRNEVTRPTLKSINKKISDFYINAYFVFWRLMIKIFSLEKYRSLYPIEELNLETTKNIRNEKHS